MATLEYLFLSLVLIWELNFEANVTVDNKGTNNAMTVLMGCIMCIE